jgi:chemosensory pili system protein ChpA (sensor histidine kinase/response regulator)
LPAAAEPQKVPVLAPDTDAIDLPVQLAEPSPAEIEFELHLDDAPSTEAPETLAFELPQDPESVPAAAMEVTELPPDFEFELPPVPLADLAEPAKTDAPTAIEQLDFAPLSEISAEPPVPTAAIPDLEVTLSDSLFDLADFGVPQPTEATAASLAEPDLPTDIPPVEEAAVAEGDAEEPVKVIGTLRIGIPLYNVYLNEADEWSRRLANELAEWSLELNQPMPDSTVGLAHALAGSSATVGFQTLSDIARALENSLQKTQSLAYGTPEHGQAFTVAAEEIRRLLHQFAAGFLKEADSRVIAALQALDQLEVPRRSDGQDSAFDVEEFQDSELTLPVPAATRLETAAAPPSPVGVWAPPVVSVQPATAVRTIIAEDEDQEVMDIVDAMDPDLFAIFEEEAQELLPQLGGALRQWAARPDNRGARDEVLRALHTLKGSSRLAGALRLGELAHRMESEIESLGSDRDFSTADLEPLLQRYDGLQANFDRVRAAGVAVQASPA